MPTKRPTAKPAKLVPKPVPKQVRKPTAARAVVPIRRNADVPKACPICGSKRLDVRKADGAVKGAAKFVAGMALPMPYRTYPEVACLSCGWRTEATG